MPTPTATPTQAHRHKHTGTSKEDPVPTPVRISVIGAGSGVFSLGLVKDLCLTDNLRDSVVSFMDVDPERLEIVHALAIRYAD
jgi:hypothetical protein